VVSSSDSRETGKENSVNTRWFVSLVWNVTDRFIDSMDTGLKAFDAAQVKTAQTWPACSVWVM
jgi:hypothetical protein